MPSKDIKALLKEAREAIKNKDFQSSLKLSKTILRDDKENYMALIFLGLSLQEIGPADQAPFAFKKAIQINPSNILAWNGLANYYEKNNINDQKELVLVYISLLGIETNEKKVNELCEKLPLMEIPVSDFKKAVENLVKITKISHFTPDTINMAWLCLVKIVSKTKPFTADTDVLKIYEEALTVVLNNPQLVTRYYYAEFVKLLYIQKNYKCLFDTAEKMFTLYSTDLTPLEYTCKAYSELVIEENDFISDKQSIIEDYCDILLRIQSNSIIGLFTKAVLNFIQANIQETKDLLKTVTSLKPSLLHAWVLLSKCYLEFGLYDDAGLAILQASKLLETAHNVNKTLYEIVDKLLLEALSRSIDKELLQKGVDICLKFQNQGAANMKIYYYLTKCYINLENFTQAKLSFSKFEEFSSKLVETNLLNAQLLHREGNIKQALELLEREESGITSEWWFELGILYWKCELYEKSLVPFLKAAKFSPNHYLYYLYLGYYYQKFNNFDKSRRCYEKAFKLNEKCIEAATELSHIYKSQKNWEANVALLESMTKGVLDTDNCWAWLQLGLNYLEQDDYTRAIDTLRFVVRANENNSHCWECLADAYMSRGAYTSALKCYQKAKEIDSTLLYPFLQIANIKQILGEYSDARIAYETILLSNKYYVPALKGLAQTCILQARQYRKLQLIGRARDCAQTALDVMTIALQKDNTLSCLWKLVGDSCFLVATFPERYCCMLVLKELADGICSEGNAVLECEELFIFAKRCYQKALSMVQDNVLIWHDLAACNLAHSLHCTNKTNTNVLLENAAIIIKHCVSLDATNWQHCNLMGVIAVNREPKEYALAQHAFIKAVQLDDNSAVAWCNLGALYFILSDFKLANEAFSQAQRADPNYVNSWVGQALIAEHVSVDEAMDLFRHSTQLGVQQEGAIGYGNWVCRALLETPSQSALYFIQNMHAVPIACDALTWYTENNPNDACAWNMLGILKERMGLNRGAAQAFKNSLRLTGKENYDKVLINYGHMLFKLHKYGEAVNVYNQVKEATFNSGSGLALSLFKDKQYKDSYETYEQALHWLTDDQGLQSDLFVALASMAYMFNGPDAAKSLLLQSTELKPPSPHGFYATLCLGLLHNDINLSKLVLKELYNLRDNLQCLPHLAVLLSFTYLLEDNHDKAVRELSKLIHCHPNNASLWFTLAILLIRSYKKRPKSVAAAANCAQLALKLGRTNMDVTNVLCIMSLAMHLSGNHDEALIAAQKSIFCYPNIVGGWIALIFTLLMNKTKLNKLNQLKWTSKFITYVKNVVDVKSPIIDWLDEQQL